MTQGIRFFQKTNIIRVGLSATKPHQATEGSEDISIFRFFIPFSVPSHDGCPYIFRACSEAKNVRLNAMSRLMPVH